MVIERRIGVAVVIPTLLVIFLLVLCPFLYNIWLGFQNLTLRKPSAEFVGLAQYVRLLRDPLYLRSKRLTLVWTFGVVIGRLIVGLPIALLSNTPFVGRGIARGLLLQATLQRIVTDGLSMDDAIAEVKPRLEEIVTG